MRGRKTILANLAVLLVAWWFRESDFYVDPFVFVVAIAVLNIGLRLITTGPARWRRG
jgi:hypothetical protein